jgi:hypothetical protein
LKKKVFSRDSKKKILGISEVFMNLQEFLGISGKITIFRKKRILEFFRNYYRNFWEFL